MTGTMKRNQITRPIKNRPNWWVLVRLRPNMHLLTAPVLCGGMLQRMCSGALSQRALPHRSTLLAVFLTGALIACGSDGVSAPNGAFHLASVSAGSRHTCGVTPAGTAYCWGDNGIGRLGDGTTNFSRTPVAVTGGLTFATLTAGGLHTCGLTPAGAAYCWGDNRNGQLGNGISNGPQICAGLFACSQSPVAVLGGLTFIALSAGEFHTCGITFVHVAYCWGYNFDGQLGRPTTGPETCASGNACSMTPVAVSGGLTFDIISAATYHTCGVTTTGAAYCWGANTEGWLGDGSPTASTTPVAVTGGLKFVSVNAATYHTCGVTTAGAAYCWGDNRSGQLGTGTKVNSLTPAAVSGGLTFAALGTGVFHGCGTTRTGAAYCWGDNASGELGNGTTVNSSTPVPVSGGLTFVAVSAGHMGSHTCGVTRGNIAYCWGANGSGQLGDSTNTDRSTPTFVRH